MAKSNFGYIGAGGLAGLQKSVEEIVADRLAAQQLAKEEALAREKLWQANLENQRNFSLNQEQLGVSKSNLKLAQDRAARDAAEAAKPLGPKPRVVSGIMLPGKTGKRTAAFDDNNPSGAPLWDVEEYVDPPAPVKPSAGFGEAFARYESRLGRPATQAEEDKFYRSYSLADDPVREPTGGAAGGEHIPAAAQTELKNLDTIESLVSEISTIGQRSNWSGIGGFGMGSFWESVKKNTGYGTADEQSLRNKIGNLRSSVSQARAGLTLTPNEEKMLDSFVGQIDADPSQLKIKMRDLVQWARNRRASSAQLYNQPDLVRPAPTGRAAGPGGAAPAGALVWEDGPDGKPRIKR